MSLFESINMALFSIKSHLLRSVLTMLGIIIGVGSIITIVAIGKGGESLLKSQVLNGGSTIVPIYYEPPMTEDFEIIEENVKPIIGEEEIHSIKDFKEVKDVITTNTINSQVYNKDTMLNLSVKATNFSYQKANQVEALSGEIITEQQFSEADNVVIINEKAKERLFKSEEAMGSIIEIEGYPFKVVGVFTEKSSEIFSIETAIAIIPIKNYPVLYGEDVINEITIVVNNPEEARVAGKKVVNFLNQRKNEELRGKYTFNDLKELVSSLSKITRIMTMIISGVAGISLLVGGIGVMNIMLVSVTERTREIGIRKALGATRGKILLQFLIESIVLTLIGGTIGIVIGAGGAYIFSFFAKWPSLISFSVVLGTLLFSMVLGVVFGLLPANKAAKLEPIDALRYE